MKKLFVLATALMVLGASAFGAEKPKGSAKAVKPTKKSVTAVFVDMRRVVQEAELSKRLQANLRAAEEAAAEATKPKFQELAEKRMAYMAQESSMTPEQKEERTKQVQALQQEAVQLQQKLKAESQKKQEEATAIFQEALEEVSESLGAELGWDAILSRSPEFAIWTSDAVDQTDLFLDRLNARPIPEGPLTAAATGTAPAPAPPPAADPGK